MNAFDHIVQQLETGPKLRTAPQPKQKAALIDSNVYWRGPQIERMRNQGMKMIDIARELDRTYGYIRGVYSQYRKAMRQGGA